MVKGPEPRLANCGRCRALYVQFRSHVCDRCIDAEESDFARIRDELSRNPGLTPDEIAFAANVTVVCVLRLLDADLLSNEEADQGARCGQCGDPAISASQRLCMGCLLDLDRKLSMELHLARLNRRPPLRGVAHHVHAVLEMKRRA